jgi:hypothetical protein
MTNTIKGFTIILIIFSCISIFGQNNTVKPLDKEIKALITNQSNSLGISQEEMKIAESIHGFGNSAIPELVKLLKHPDSQVRKRTAFTLSLFNDIDEIYLDDLIEALNNGEEWLAPNIAKIGSDKAINSLIDAIKKNKEAEVVFDRGIIKNRIDGRGERLPRGVEGVKAILLFVIEAGLSELANGMVDALQGSAKPAVDGGHPFRSVSEGVLGLLFVLKQRTLLLQQAGKFGFRAFEVRLQFFGLLREFRSETLRPFFDQSLEPAFTSLHFLGQPAFSRNEGIERPDRCNRETAQKGIDLIEGGVVPSP